MTFESETLANELLAEADFHLLKTQKIKVVAKALVVLFFDTFFTRSTVRDEHFVQISPIVAIEKEAVREVKQHGCKNKNQCLSEF